MLERVGKLNFYPRKFFPTTDNIANDVKIVRGDDYKFSMFVNEKSKLSPTQYKLKDNDKIYFGIFEVGKTIDDAIIKKTYTKDSKVDEHGNIIVHITNGDTELLRPGKYYYQAILQNEEVTKTIIPARPIIIID